MTVQRPAARKKRIIINVLNITDEHLAGAAIFSRNVLSAWLIREDDMEVTILHSSKIDATRVLQLPQKPGVRTKGVPVGGFLSRIVYEQVVMPFTVRGYDIYFSPTQILPFISRVLFRKTRMVTTVHDMIPFFVKNKYGYLRTQYVRLISKWGPVFSDSVVVVSENTLKDVVQLTGISPSKIHVVYNFLTSDYEPNNLNDGKYFICISTVEPGKNLENTLSGFARFIEKYQRQDYSFYWLGKIGWGYTAEELNGKIAQAGLQNKFHLLGFVKESEKQQLLEGCSAMIYLSHYEGFGIPVLEGLYHNKPAVVSRSSSLPEVIGSAGILCDHKNVEEIADSMQEMITNLHRYRAFIPAQIRKFKKEVQIKNFMKVIHGL